MAATANTVGSLGPLFKATYASKAIVPNAPRKKGKFKHLSKYLQK